MNRWMRRIVAILEIGGGFMGVMALLLTEPWAKGFSPGTTTISLVILCLALLGLAAGLLVAEGRQLGLWLSLLYQVVQVPIIVSAAVTYQFLPGLQIVAGHFGDSGSLFFQCQSKFAFFIGRPPEASGWGLNLSALFFFLYLAWALGKSLTRATPSQRNVASTQTPVGDSLAVR